MRKAIPSDGITLVPVSFAVNLVKGGGQASGIDLGTTLEAPITWKVAIAPAVRKQAAQDKGEFLAAFWLVGTTTDAGKANMNFKFVNHDVPEGAVRSDPFGIPTLFNFKAVEAGDELLFYRQTCMSKYPSIEELAPRKAKRTKITKPVKPVPKKKHRKN